MTYPGVIPHTLEGSFPIDELVPDKDNPNRGDVDAIEQSISAGGYYGVVIAQASSKRIIAGHHRVAAAKRSGITTVPVMFLHVDDDHASAIMIGDNQHARRSVWDSEQLAITLQSIRDKTPDLLAMTAYEPDDISGLIDRLNIPTDGAVAGAFGQVVPGEPDFVTMTFTLPADKREVVDEALRQAMSVMGEVEGNAMGHALVRICENILTGV